MTELILVRHGETDWNKTEVFRGRVDIALNEIGMRQAALLAEYLGGESLDAVYSSPAKRAMQTAKLVARRHEMEVKSAPGLIDFDYGAWQGRSHREVRDKYPALYAEWLGHPERVTMPEGESLEAVRRRALPVVDEVARDYSGTVALVSHRVVHKVLICALLGLGNDHFWNIRLDTCGITRFTYEPGRFVLVAHNDTSFLKPLGSGNRNDF